MRFMSTSLACLLLLSACGKDPLPPSRAEKGSPGEELLLINGAIYTVDERQPWVEALAISGGEISWRGSRTDAQRRVGPNTRVVDLKGKMVLPGFQDVHIHPVHSGVSYQQCALFDIVGRQALLDQVQRCTKAKPKGWILGGGWSLDNFAPSGLPDRMELDVVTPGQPVALKSSDGHSLWVNTAALEAAGIDRNTPDPAGGRIDRYPGTTIPSGSLQEDSAMALVLNVAPAPTARELELGLAYARDHLHSLGITAVQDALVKLKPGEAYYGLEAYRALDQRGELNLHVVAAMYWENEVNLASQLQAFEHARQEYSKGLVSASAIKIWQDGVLETETAALLAPYSNRDDGFSGKLLNSQKTLDEAVTALDAAGFQVHFHALGDRAIRSALDALEVAQSKNGARDSRHHLSHIELFDPSDIPRFRELGAIANFQPLWAINDRYISELTLPRIGSERARWLYPIGSLWSSGATVAFGSDWYVTSANPLDGIEAAVTRLEPNGNTYLPLGKGEELSLDQAIRAYTLNSAHVNFLDRETGSLEVGKRADLVVLDRNLFDIPASEINESRVTATLFGGKTVFGNL